MDEATLLQNALKRIEALELQVADLRGIRLIQESTTAKPVNRAAYQKALDAFVSGDRKAIREYLKYYTVPGVSAGGAHGEGKTQLTRGRAVVGRKPHNLRVAGSKPAHATK